MSAIILKAQTREPGTKTAKALRAQGIVPGVYYAKGQDPIHFSVNALTLRPVVYTAEATMIKLNIEGKEHNCVLKATSFDPVTDKLLHIDFLGVLAGESLKMEIPLHIIGTAVGVREGGVLEQTIHKVHAMVDPTAMPEHIDIDVTNLKLNSAIHISDVNVPGIKITDRPENVIVACHLPKVVAAEEETTKKK